MRKSSICANAPLLKHCTLPALHLGKNLLSGRVRFLPVLLFFLPKINSTHPDIFSRSQGPEHVARIGWKAEKQWVASLLQASDWLICINHLVKCLLNQRGTLFISIFSVIYITLFWFPTFFIALISRQSICTRWTTVITPLRLGLAVLNTRLCCSGNHQKIEKTAVQGQEFKAVCSSAF